MSQYYRGRRPDPFESSGLNMNEVWKNALADDIHQRQPKPNSLEEVPYNLLIHSLDNLYDVRDAVVVDRNFGDLIIKKLNPLHQNMTRQKIQLDITGSDGTLVVIYIWAIPIFSEGVMVYLLYAADYENRQLLRTHRNPSRPEHYDITSF